MASRLNRTIVEWKFVEVVVRNDEFIVVSIEPLWNGNSVQYAGRFSKNKVSIEPLWNGNQGKSLLWGFLALGLNRTIVEWKSSLVIAFAGGRFSHQRASQSNHCGMEMLQGEHQRGQERLSQSNHCGMEICYTTTPYYLVISPVSIEPLWNGNLS